MSELAQAEVKTETPEELFYRLMEQMPANMALYQELQQERNDLWTQLKSYRNSLIDKVDITQTAETHPQGVAYNALGLYVVERKIMALEKQMHDLDYAGEWTKFIDLHGRKVRVEPLGDIWKIDEIAPGHNYIGSTKRQKAGTLIELNLRPSEGGRLHFKTRFSGDNHRSASPLFDHLKREPQFRVEFLE